MIVQRRRARLALLILIVQLPISLLLARSGLVGGVVGNLPVCHSGQLIAGAIGVELADCGHESSQPPNFPDADAHLALHGSNLGLTTYGAYVSAAQEVFMTAIDRCTNTDSPPTTYAFDFTRTAVVAYRNGVITTFYKVVSIAAFQALC